MSTFFLYIGLTLVSIIGTSVSEEATNREESLTESAGFVVSAYLNTAMLFAVWFGIQYLLK